MKNKNEIKLETLIAEVANASGNELGDVHIAFLRFLDRDRELAAINKERKEKVNTILSNKTVLGEIITKTAKTNRELDCIVNSIAYDSDVLDIMFILASQASHSRKLEDEITLLKGINYKLKKENSRLWLKVANLKRRVKKAASMTFEIFK